MGWKDKLSIARSSKLNIEGLKATLATSKSSISPNVLIAAGGFINNGSLSIAPAASLVTSQIGSLSAIDFPSASTIASNLSVLQSQLFSNPINFGNVVGQIQSHIEDSTDITKILNFTAGSEYSDFGSGIEGMSDFSDLGISKIFTNSTTVTDALNVAGNIYDTSDMPSFGTPGGFIKSLYKFQLESITGIKTQIDKLDISESDLTNPIYTDIFTKMLSSVTSQTALLTVCEQFTVNPSTVTSLLDFTNISKLVGYNVSGLSLTDIGSKFSELNVSFSNKDEAVGLVQSLELPIASAEGDLIDVATDPGIVSQIYNSINPVTGIVPSPSDFLETVTGGNAMSSISSAIASGIPANISAALTNASDLITKSNQLLAGTGIDFAAVAGSKLSNAMNFAGSLHSHGASPTGIANSLKSMATTDRFGTALKLSLIEGKNLAKLSEFGGKRLYFGLE